MSKRKGATAKLQRQINALMRFKVRHVDGTHNNDVKYINTKDREEQSLRKSTGINF